jgi:hypothetical protein
MSTDGLHSDRYTIMHGDGRPVDPACKYFVLKLTGNTPHAAACRAALTTYADRMAPFLPRLAADCRALVAAQAVPGEALPPGETWVASVDGADFSGPRYATREIARAQGRIDRGLAPDAVIYTGYLGPLRLCGDVHGHMRDMTDSLTEQGFDVTALRALCMPEAPTPEQAAAAESNTVLLESYIGAAVQAWAAACGVSTAGLWCVTAIEP